MTKPTLIVLHGALGAKDQFNRLIELLSKNFNVHTLNFSGHGGLNTDTNYSIELFSNDLDNYLQNQGINSTYIFGYSMGGYVALNLARSSSKIKSVFTLGTKFNWTEKSSKHEVKMLNPEIIENKVPHFAKTLNDRHYPADWKIVMNKTAKMMLELGQNPVLTSTELLEIKIPVMVGIGSLDTMVSKEESEQTVQHLGNGELRIFDDFKHPIEQVNQELLAESIIKYFISK